MWQIDNALSGSISSTLTGRRRRTNSVIDFTLGIEAIVHDGASTASEAAASRSRSNGGADRPNLVVQDATGERGQRDRDRHLRLAGRPERDPVDHDPRHADGTRCSITARAAGQRRLAACRRIDLGGLTLTPAPNSDSDLAPADRGDQHRHRPRRCHDLLAKSVLNITVDAVAGRASLAVRDAVGNPATPRSRSISARCSATTMVPNRSTS